MFFFTKFEMLLNLYFVDSVDEWFAGVFCGIVALVAVSSLFDWYLKRKHIEKTPDSSFYQIPVQGKCETRVFLSFPINFTIVKCRCTGDDQLFTSPELVSPDVRSTDRCGS